MTERPVVSILMHDAEGDPVAGGAVEVLERLAEVGFIAPLWTVDVGHGSNRDWTVNFAGPQGRRECSGLLHDIADGGAVDVAQVIAVATDSSSGAADVAVLADDVAETVSALRLHQPLDARVVDARVVAPLRMDRCSPTVGLFSSHADLNLLLIPEDRESDEHFGAPLSLERPDQYAAHVAAEVASHGGLWKGMNDSPMTRGSAGVIGHGDPKVVFGRSYARVLIGPPVPLAAAVGDLDHLPVPGGRERAQDPSHDVALVARELIETVPGLSYRRPEPYTPPVQTLDTRTTASRLLKEVTYYLRSIPSQLRAGVFADLDQLAAEALTRAIGPEAVIEVEWTGTGSLGEPPTVDSMLRRARQALARSARIRDASLVNGDGWSDVIATALAMADGGRFAPGVERPHNRGRLAVITDLEMLSPPLDADPQNVVVSLEEYVLPADPVDLGGAENEDDADDAGSDSSNTIDQVDRSDAETDASSDGELDAWEPPVADLLDGIAAPDEAAPRVLLSELVARVGSQRCEC